MSTIKDLTTEEQIMLRSSERVLAKLPSGRFVMATFTAITPAEIERAIEIEVPPTVAPPSFMEVVEACELIGQGACRPFASLRQIACLILMGAMACLLSSCTDLIGAAWGAAYHIQGGFGKRPIPAKTGPKIGSRPETGQDDLDPTSGLLSPGPCQKRLLPACKRLQKPTQHEPSPKDQAPPTIPAS